jgi:HEAT repeat protein
MVPGTYRTLGALLACGCLVAGAALARPAPAVGQTPPAVPPEVRNLVDRLLSSDPQERGNAARALGPMGENAVPAVESLIAALNHPEWKLQAAAARSLGEIGDPRAAEPLVGLLSGRGPLVEIVGPSTRQYGEPEAVSGPLVKLGAAAVEPLIRFVQEKPPSTPGVVRALAALGQIGDRRAVPAVVAVLESPDRYEPRVRCQAIIALKAFKDPRAIDALAKAAREKDRSIHGAAGRALGAVGGEAVPRLIDVLSDEDPRIRYAAAEALGPTRDPRAVGALLKVMSDPDPYVRCYAAQALARIGDPRAVRAVLALLKDANQEVRQAARSAMAFIEGPTDLQALAEALGDKNAAMREAAVMGLDQAGNEGVPLLVNALKDEAESIRERTAQALLRIGDPRAVGPLVARLKEEHQAVKLAAIKSLVRIGRPEAVPSLIDTLLDTDRPVWGDALMALRTLTGQGFGGDPAEWRHWWNANKDTYKEFRGHP